MTRLVLYFLSRSIVFFDSAYCIFSIHVGLQIYVDVGEIF